MVLQSAGSPVGEGLASESFRLFILKWMEGLILAGSHEGFRGHREGPGEGKVEELAELFGICSHLDALVAIRLQPPLLALLRGLLQGGP